MLDIPLLVTSCFILIVVRTFYWITSHVSLSLLCIHPISPNLITLCLLFFPCIFSVFPWIILNVYPEQTVIKAYFVFHSIFSSVLNLLKRNAPSNGGERENIWNVPPDLLFKYSCLISTETSESQLKAKKKSQNTATVKQ